MDSKVVCAWRSHGDGDERKLMNSPARRRWIAATTLGKEERETIEEGNWNAKLWFIQDIISARFQGVTRDYYFFFFCWQKFLIQRIITTLGAKMLCLKKRRKTYSFSPGTCNKSNTTGRSKTHQNGYNQPMDIESGVLQRKNRWERERDERFYLSIEYLL